MNPLIQNAREGAPRPGGVRTLVIDDDPSIVRFIEIYLENQGFVIASALTGEDGLALAARLLPDLILLDHMMPGLDGIEVLRRLKDNEQTQRIPVVILTARSDVGEKVKGLDLGVDDYITKPFDIRELKARLLSVVARRREQDETTEAAKLKTLREVVASVSHEVNNPLAAILMCAEALELRGDANPYVRDKSRVIQENALRIRDILKRLERVKVLASKPYVAKDRILDLYREDDP